MFGRNRRDSPLALSDEWNLAQGMHEGLPLIVRARSGGLALRARGYVLKVAIAVPMNNPRSDGLPDAAEQAQLNAIEDLIEELTASRAEMVLVLTTGGMREFVIYARDDDWLHQFQQDLRAGARTHQVQFEVHPDPAWQVYTQFV